MQAIWNALVSTAVIGLLILCGYISGARGWMGKETKAFLSKFIMTIAIPFMCIYGMNTNLNREMLLGSGYVLLVPFCCSVSGFLLSYAVGKLVKMPRYRMGVFMTMCAMSNTMFVGYAMSRELFGDVSVPYVMLTYFISTSLTQTAGTALIQWSGGANAFSPHTAVKRLLHTPPIYGILVAMSCVLFGIPVPAIVLSFGRYMSNLVAPMAMLVSGFIIYEIGLRNLRLERDMLLVLLFRFVLAPAITAVGCAVFGLEGLARSVVMVQCAMPVVSTAVIASTEYGADEQFAARGVAVTTLGSLLVVPFIVGLL